MPKGTTDKTKAKIPEIIQFYKDGKTQKQVAEHYSVNRRTIKDIQDTDEFQTQLWQVTQHLLTSIMNDIEEMGKSTSPQDRRTALVEKGKMFGRLSSKLLPTLVYQKTESTHYTVTPEQLGLRRFFDKLCPDCQRACADVIREELPEPPVQKQATVKVLEN